MLFGSKQSLGASGLYSGYTDWHSHILPGVDDGLQSAEDSLRILALYESLGVRVLWLTPHIMEDVPNETDFLRLRFEWFSALYKASAAGLNALPEDFNPRADQYDYDDEEEGFGADWNAEAVAALEDAPRCKGTISLHLAAENMIDNLLVARLDAGDLLPIGPKADHLLVETRYVSPPVGMREILSRIQSMGYHPILAHPERYTYMSDKDYHELAAKGICLQLNIPSLTGTYGSEAETRALHLLSEGLYTLTGHDLHSYRFLRHLLEHKLPRRTLDLVKQAATRGFQHPTQ